MLKPKQESDSAQKQNLAELVLINPFAPYTVPSVLWLVCAESQILLNELVGMSISDGYFIVQLTHGVRILSIFLFGLKGLLTVLLAPLVYFYIFNRPTYNTPEVILLLQVTCQTLAVFVSFWAVQKFRNLNQQLDGIEGIDVYATVIASALLATVVQIPLVPHTQQIPTIEILTFSFFSKIVGGLIVYFGIMFILSKLQTINVKSRTN